MPEISSIATLPLRGTFDPEKHKPEKKIILVHARIPQSLPETLFISADEQKKADKFIKKEDRHAYLIRHHLLRSWLSVWLNDNPDHLTFEKNPFGKPFLNKESIHFNMSRSGDELAFAFAPAMVGIDIELCRKADAFFPVAYRYFHPAEQKMIRTDDDFFYVWTRKEAVLKAQGIGIYDGFADIDCSGSETHVLGHSFQLNSLHTGSSIISFAAEKLHSPLEVCYLESEF